MTGRRRVDFRTKRLKYAVSLRRSRVDDDSAERPYVGLEQIETSTGRLVGHPPLSRGESLGSNFEPGDVLFGKLRPYLAKAWVAKFPGRCTTELLVMQPATVEARFLRDVCLSPAFIDAVDASTFGSKMPRAEWSFIGRIPIPVPPLDTQCAIVDYLDRETARLDALVAAKERVLGLLAEKRRVLITRAVTRGLDPHAPLRDSGIPWLGEIPAHWEVVRLRFLATGIEQGWSPEAASLRPALEDWGVLKLNAVNRGHFDEKAAKTLPPDAEPRADLEIQSGNILVTRSNTPLLVGDACFVETTRPRLMLSDIIYRLAVRTDAIDGKFLVSFLVLPVGRVQIENDARGTSASMVKISQEHIKNWRIPVPPMTEQRSIMATLARETRKIDQLHAATERTIRLIKERRSALIAAAVTGHLAAEDRDGDIRKARRTEGSHADR